MVTMRCSLCQQTMTAADGAEATCPDCARAAEKHWTITRGGKRAGPYAWLQIQELATRGQLRPDDMLSRVGVVQAVAVRDLRALAPAAKNSEPKVTVTPPQRGRAGILLGIIAGVALAGVLTVAIVGFCAIRAFVPAETKPAPVAAIQDDAKKPAVPPKEDVAKKSDASPPGEKPPPEEKQPVSPPQPKVSQELADAVVKQLNTYRKMAGLGLVRSDAELSRGCVAHAKYLALNPSNAGDAAKLALEESGKPGFSAEGRRAAGVAMVAVGDAKTAIDRWMGRLGGRLPLLQQNLRAVGVAVVPLGDGASATVLDVMRGSGDSVVLYPRPGQADVPLTCAGGPEFTDPNVTAGFPVSATFPPARMVKQVKGELLDGGGKTISVLLYTPEKPARPTGQRNTIALIAKAPLQGNRAYRVRMSATVDRDKWSKDWTFTTEDDADTKGLWAKKALDKVNGIRTLAGLAPVVLDAQLTKGCAAHARYLALNLGQTATLGLGAHDEDMQLPGASEEGRKAGKASDIAIGDHNPLHGIDAWMATLYHRVPILEPNLKSIGYGCARARRQGWVTVMNITSGRDRSIPRPHAVFYPVPGQMDVPLHFPIGGEEPNPIPKDTTGKAGYPVTAFFPVAAPLKAPSGFLSDEAGKDVPVWFSSAEQPANPKHAGNQGNTVCMISKQPLRPNTTYRVVLRGQLEGQAFDKAWQFTTGSAGPTPALAAKQALLRLNDYRTKAGLPAVTLDAELCTGCQAHAEYLVRNAAIIAKKRLLTNDEDSALPGYTAYGLAAARRSDVLSNAPEPIAQIDDLMGTFMRRINMLDPQLQRIGFGCAREVGRGWQCVLDLNGGRGGNLVVRFPVPDQEHVPCAGAGRLPGRPGMPGFPISVTFPAQLKLLGGRGVLTDADGKTIETLLTTPEHPLESPAAQRNSVCVHPLAPLLPGRTYSVTVSVVVNGQEWRQTWQFTTE
jgi:uncharacterized protein YkwD